MRFPISALFAFLMTCSVSTAWAQYGLYGAPNMLPVQQNTTVVYPAPVAYPAQPAAQTAYQPYQPAAQYRYPAPNCQPTTWAAPVEQPMANPGPTMIPAPAPTNEPNQLQRPMQPAPGYAPAPQGYAPAPQGYAPAPQGYAPPPQNYPSTQGCGLMNQMCAEQPNGNGCYGNGGCGQNVLCDQGECLWYSSFSALVLGRSPARRVWTGSRPYPNEQDQLSNTDIPMSWKWGGEVQLGRRFCCGCTPLAVRATFWTTEAMTGSETTTNPYSPYTISTPLQTDNINFYLPNSVIVPATTFFTNAASSTVSRRDEFYDFEINLLRERLAWTCDSGWEIGWSFGVRYFRFQEALSVSVINNDVGGLGVGDAYFKDTVTNNLVGPQIGFDLAYNLGNNFRLFATPTFGVCANIVDSSFQAQGRLGSGAYADGTNTITGYPNFPAHGANTGIAFLTQIDMGADWQFARNWSARAGYRVVAMTGMGLADDEYPQYLCDTPEMHNPQHSSSLVLHGAFFGVTYNF
jgi:hypothetical protein